MKTVLVTGGNKGIGLEFCRQYKELGFNVIATCREPSDELKALEVQIIKGIDITDTEVGDKITKGLNGSKIDLLLNNAGMFLNETIEDMNFETITKQFEVNVLGPLKVTMALLPHLNKGSKVGIVSSRMGSITDNNSGAYYGYRVTKAGVNAAGKSLAVDLKPKGISVALLHPGYVKTEMTGFNGDITPDQAASGLIKIMDKTNLENTGMFWHSNGENLPW